MKFQDYLKSIDACEEARGWVGSRGLKKSWHKCRNGFWMEWLVVKATPKVVAARAACDQARAAYDQACAACDQARAAYGQACAACDQARAACDQACAAYGQACDQACAAYADAIREVYPDPPKHIVAALKRAGR